MSGKTYEPKSKTDPRVQRTHHSLGFALIQLMHQKPFDTITVQEVLDLAGVSRSTFYAHYSDKDDLFMTEADQFFEKMSNLLLTLGEVSNRVAPVRELFAHVAEMRAFISALRAAGKLHDNFELGQSHFARAIEQRLAQLSPAHKQATPARAALAYAQAGAMFSLMSWWLEHDTPSSPAEMDALFHQMFWAGIGEDSTASSSPHETPPLRPRR